MYKVDKIKSLVDCDLCHKLLGEPVATVCGYSVCKSHFDKFEGSFDCDLCSKTHKVPDDGFTVNRILQEA